VSSARAVLYAVAALAAAACAHIEAPTGGAEDRLPPQLVATRPDTFARVPSYSAPVVFVFDEGLSEQDLETGVNVSPRTSSVAVDKRGDEIRVSLRRGWEPNRIYQVELDTVVRDLFNNRITEGVRLVFSTGPTIPETLLTGTVLDRQTARPAGRVRVEAILQPDSLVYSTRTDAEGGFAFAQIPEGSYRIRAYNDPNANRSLEGFEARDTAVARVAVTTPAQVALSIVQPDSTPPKMASASVENGIISVRFDDYLAVGQTFTPAQVTLLAPDSVTRLAVAAVALGSFPDTAAAARPDTAAARPGARPPARDTAGTRRAAADTAARRPAPSQTLVVRPAAPLLPNAQYTIRVAGVRNLVGLVGGGEVRFRTPAAAPAPADSTPARARPPAGQPATPPARTPATPPAAPAPRPRG